MKRITLLAVPLLAVGLLAGCGNDSSSTAAGSPSAPSSSSSSSGDLPTDASVQEFCQTFIGLLQGASQQGKVTDAQAVKLAKDLASKLEKLGTPATMPDDARRGFQTAIDKINAIPDDATKKDMSKAAADLTKAEQADQQALSDYLTQTCMPLAQSGGASGSGSNPPSPSAS